MASQVSNDIERRCKRYVRQAWLLHVSLYLLGLLSVQLGHYYQFLTPLADSVLFAMTVETTGALVWKRIAVKSPDALPSFFMAVSGFRFLLALIVMFAYFLFAGKDAMLSFFLVFAVSYVAMLLHHTRFFYHQTPQA